MKKKNSRWWHWIVFLSCAAFWINTVCPVRVARSCQRQCFSPTEAVFTVHWAPLCLPFCRCISEPVVPAGDHLWSGSFQRLPLCIMEAMLAAAEWPFPSRYPQGGALPGRRPAACPHRGKKTKLQLWWPDRESWQRVRVSPAARFLFWCVALHHVSDFPRT